MKKLLNISSFTALIISYQHLANAAPVSTIPVATPTAVAKQNPIPAPKMPVATPAAVAKQNPAPMLPQQVGPVTWLQKKYRFPSNLAGTQGTTYVDDQTGEFYQAADGKTFAQTAISGKIPTNLIQKRPPIFQVPSWLLQKWESDNNDSDWYYLPPTAESPLSRNIKRAPNGALEAQLVPQPQQIRPTQWSAQGYQYPTYSGYMVYVNDQSGQSYVVSSNNSKFELENVPLSKRQKRPLM